MVRSLPRDMWRAAAMASAAACVVALAATGAARAEPTDTGLPRDGICRGCVVHDASESMPLLAGCGCHENAKAWWTHHTVGEPPSPELASRIPAELPLPDGRLACVTCHDPALVCDKEGAPRSGLRGGPWLDRSDPCYQCHDAEAYQRFDSHAQVDTKGRFLEQTCLYCHDRVAERGRAGSAGVVLIDKVDRLCVRCHQVGPHPANVDHDRVPSRAMLKRMEGLEETYNVALTLDSSGRMTCVTCHNPHERGVIPVAEAGARGASDAGQLRLPRILCASCHDK